jgi:serine/threonine protein kinase
MKSFVAETDYKIVREIAHGGMGTVYEAMQHGAEGFEKRVAIKTLLPRFLSSKRITEMFLREAKLVADLVHENIVQIYQLGIEDKSFYIVLEYVHGISLHDLLSDVIKADDRIPLELAIFITSRIARGLAYAHKRRDPDGNPLKIVHRDVCPRNILITSEGLPKLTDFGLANVVEDQSNKPMLVGKVHYMPPEQARRENVDFKADIYALASILFELIAQTPIRYAKDKEGYLELCKSGHVDWEYLRSDLPKEITNLIKSCLEVDPNKRPNSTDQLARELELIIYRDGYGPTINSLEQFLRERYPGLYRE